MPKTTYRVVARGPDGGLRIRDFPDPDYLLKTHTQIGIDYCSTDLELRGMPVFRGLVGPMPEGKHIILYETPEVFETLTKEWSVAKVARFVQTFSSVIPFRLRFHRSSYCGKFVSHSSIRSRYPGA